MGQKETPLKSSHPYCTELYKGKLGSRKKEAQCSLNGSWKELFGLCCFSCSNYFIQEEENIQLQKTLRILKSFDALFPP